MTRSALRRHVPFVRVLPITIVVLLSIGPIAASAQTTGFVFSIVHEEFDTVAGTGVPFGDFSVPSVDGTRIAFISDAGVIRTDTSGQAIVVADGATLQPGTSGGTFSSFPGIPSISGTTVVFVGQSSGRIGFYSGTGSGGVSLIADDTTLPGGLASMLDWPSIGSRIVYSARGASVAGVYSPIQGGTETIADNLTPVPPFSTPFVGVFDAVTAGSHFAYVAILLGGGEAIYRRDTSFPFTGEHVEIARAGPAFSFLTNPAVDVLPSGEVCFATGTGFFRGSGGPTTVVADFTTAEPGGSGTFTAFGLTCSIHAGQVLFTAEWFDGVRFRNGLFLEVLPGQLVRVIGDNDLVEGEPIFGIGIGRDSLGTNQIAFTATVGDVSNLRRALITTVPEPGGTLSSLTAAIALVALRARRSRP